MTRESVVPCRPECAQLQRCFLAVRMHKNLWNRITTDTSLNLHVFDPTPFYLHLLELQGVLRRLDRVINLNKDRVEGMVGQFGSDKGYMNEQELVRKIKQFIYFEQC